MIHTILLPDIFRGRELRTVTWDDEAGTVGGDHHDVPWLREQLDAPRPLVQRAVWGRRTLVDPAHRAEDFLALMDDVRNAVLPESLRGVEPTPWPSYPRPPDLPPGVPVTDVPGD